MVRYSRGAQLIAYPDAMGGTLRTLADLLSHEMQGWFPGGVHVLPPFPSSADRGYAPLRYDRIEPRFGTWSDLEALARLTPVTLDVMVNHLSRHAPEFLDYERRGRSSPHADLFLRPDKVWPGGEVPAEDLRRLFLRKPDHPFLDVAIAESGATERVWATFGSSRNESEQIDLDWTSPLTLTMYESWFATLAAAGVAEVRLDAVGYLVKRPGTSCFMVEPEIWDAIGQLAAVAERHGLAILPEVHATPDVVEQLDDHGYATYDFVLPGLVLEALRTTRPRRLVAHLAHLSSSRVTTLDCHDGIPIQPDLIGVVHEVDLMELTERLVQRGANVNRILGAAERGIGFDAHQVNISYLDAAGGDDGMAVARAVQLFAPGRPQVYYQGLLGGGNDDGAVEATGEGRAINRTDYSVDAVRRALRSDIAQRQCRLLELRAGHPAFDAERPTVEQTCDVSFCIRWEHDAAWCQLDVDLAAVTATVSTSPDASSGPGSDLPDGPI